jgi:predicted kinase
MRGIPGSGKSTWLKANRPNALICSADNFFMVDGIYRYDAALIGSAHNMCLREFVRAVEQELPDIAVDNTNVRVYEIAPYYRVAQALEYKVEIVWMQCMATDGIDRNIHAVPQATIWNMANSFEPLPPTWNIQHVRT